MSTSVVDTYPSSESALPCQRENAELFFAQSPSDTELAKALCQKCPVRTECLAGALERREPWGVWGGKLFLSGLVVSCKRPPGRPRKDTAVGVANPMSGGTASDV